MTSSIDDPVKAAFDKVVEDFDKSCQEARPQPKSNYLTCPHVCAWGMNLGRS